MSLPSLQKLLSNRKFWVGLIILATVAHFFLVPYPLPPSGKVKNWQPLPNGELYQPPNNPDMITHQN